MDTGGYLRRFVDLECSLPQVNKREYIMHLTNGYTHELLENLLIAFDFSLRDLEKITTVIKINDRFNNFFKNISYKDENQMTYLATIGYFFFLFKYKNPVLYIKLKNKTLTEDEKLEIAEIFEDKIKVILPSFTDENRLALVSKETAISLITELMMSSPIREFKISSGVKINIANMVNSNGINKLLDISLYF